MDARSRRDGYRRAQLLRDRLLGDFRRVAWIGLEHEFYFTAGQAPAWQQVLARYRREAGGLVEVAPERGRGQYELVFPPSPDLEFIARIHSWAVSALRSAADRAGVPVSFMSRPFRDRLGSSLQVSISLRDEASRPMFYRPPGGKTENAEVLQTVNGMLTSARPLMTAFAPTPNCYQRYQRLIMEDELFSPATVSWGYGTRAAAIRIPSTGGTPGEARVEHRLAGAAADPSTAIPAVLYGAYLGLGLRARPAIPKLLGKAVHDADVTLPKTLEEAERWPRPEFFTSSPADDGAAQLAAAIREAC
jgi:glutamine synthetase